jgi:hypothetical protein
MEDKRNTTGEPDQGGIGRSNFMNEVPGNAGQNEEKGYRDLSMIDQCEGNMNNGTMGGNFEDDIQIGRGREEENTIETRQA